MEHGAWGMEHGAWSMERVLIQEQRQDDSEHHLQGDRGDGVHEGVPDRLQEQTVREEFDEVSQADELPRLPQDPVGEADPARQDERIRQEHKHEEDSRRDQEVPRQRLRL